MQENEQGKPASVDPIVIQRIEFDDTDDPESRNKWPPRFRCTPESVVLALPNAKYLTAEDQVVLANALRMSYEQGKRVGKAG